MCRHLTGVYQGWNNQVRRLRFRRSGDRETLCDILLCKNYFVFLLEALAFFSVVFSEYTAFFAFCTSVSVCTAEINLSRRVLTPSSCLFNSFVSAPLSPPARDGALPLKFLRSCLSNLSEPGAALPAKQSLQYTGRSPVGRNGTSHRLLQLLQIASCISTGRESLSLPPKPRFSPARNPP